MMPPPGSVTILVPAKNEEGGIRETLASLPVEELRERGHHVEVLVVDGNSTDRTRDIARAAGARILRQTGKGKGTAVRDAMGVIATDYVAMLDADDTYPAERIPDFVRLLDRGFDVVMGSRLRGEMEPDAMNPTNRFGNMGLSLLATVLYGRRCTDVCTGLWAWRRAAVAALPLRSVHFEVEAELYSESMKAGLNVVEVPISYRARVGETKLSKARDGLRIATTLLARRVEGFRTVVPERRGEPAPRPARG